MNLRTHKRRASAGMARRVTKATENGLRYGPACHPFRVRLQWCFTETNPWNPARPTIFQRDAARYDYTRSVPRGQEADR
jgi:hypothetical protein